MPVEDASAARREGAEPSSDSSTSNALASSRPRESSGAASTFTSYADSARR